LKKRNTTPAIYTPTLVDSDAHRHIIPSRDKPALCGATGEQDAPRDHRVDTLCLRCRQKYMRGILGTRLQEFGL
jgi:hypothetical protein